MLILVLSKISQLGHHKPNNPFRQGSPRSRRTIGTTGPFGGWPIGTGAISWLGGDAGFGALDALDALDALALALDALALVVMGKFIGKSMGNPQEKAGFKEVLMGTIQW